MSIKHLTAIAATMAVISAQAHAKTEVEMVARHGWRFRSKRSMKLPLTLTLANPNTRLSQCTKVATQKP